MVSDNISISIKSLTRIAIVSIIAMAIICLASLGFTTKLSMGKEKIEVTTNYSNLENKIDM